MARDDAVQKQREEEEKNREELSRRISQETPPPWKNAAYMAGILLLGSALNVLLMVLLEGSR